MPFEWCKTCDRWTDHHGEIAALDRDLTTAQRERDAYKKEHQVAYEAACGFEKERDTAIRNMKNYQGLMEYAKEQGDTLRASLAAAQARIAALEEAYNLWDQHCFVKIVRERRELIAKLDKEREDHFEDENELAIVQKQVAKLEDQLNAYKNALRVHRQAEELVLMREKEWQGCQDPGYVVIDGGALIVALEFSKDLSLENRDNLRADLRVAEERIAAMTERIDAAADTYAQYMELIHAVETKYGGESRHQTALRYIKDAEQSGDQGCESLTAAREPAKEMA